ncbi:hypothetical protein V2J09_020392 [Rumex salicifolius]
MKNLLKKLNAMSNEADSEAPSTASKGKKMNFSLGGSISRLKSQSESSKPFSAVTGWFNSVTNRKSHSSPSSPSNSSKKEETIEQVESTRSVVLESVPLDAGVHGCETIVSKDPSTNEEYQIQLAMELSAKEDPEACQIEAVKQISLGSYPTESDPAEVVAYRYWNYSALGYNDKILDGFYDVYGVITGSNSSKMPSLVDLQGMSASEAVSWEVILVNKHADANLLKLERKALLLANTVRTKSVLLVSIELVEEIARLVANYMGGPVGDPGNTLRAWKSLTYSLKSTLGSMVLPLGSLTIGLARHRALLFKVLADSVGIPCQLVKGHQYTGSDEVAMNIVKFDAREFIVDLMADPGTLIPCDGLGTHVEYEEPFSSPSPVSRDIDSSTACTSSSGAISSYEELSSFETLQYRNRVKRQPGTGNDCGDDCQTGPSSLHRLAVDSEDSKPDLPSGYPPKVERLQAQEFPLRATYPLSHIRSPSWTEGYSPPTVQKMKVDDVSQMVIDAAKGNPQFAQKLHDALLESGVVAPPNLFSGIHSVSSDAKAQAEDNREMNKNKNESKQSKHKVENFRPFLPPLPHRGGIHKSTSLLQLEYHNKNVSGDDTGATPMRFGNVPVAAAAVAAAAVVASSVVAAVAKSSPDSNIELPMAVSAAVVATTAAVNMQYEHLEASQSAFERQFDGDVDDPQSGDRKESDGFGANSDGERTSDRSIGTDSVRSEAPVDDVFDCEIAWEEITLGERIGLGSYGEVYHGDWHGTEVAVKRFLDQDFFGESLEEFKSEVRIMKKLRHPNVVLFMGAVTHPPNLSIVTEFLPRGSLYRLIHRPNNQLDERRRLRMAFDVARGMNYLHNCSPVIVHRDLKSPNLLVDRNWVVKVCDFGLSRMKNSTFLSSRSTAGTAEWMAPEVLRNEPANEKCDVYSFGVILWELCTLQQPWGGMNPMQVVGAVGFQHRRLDIPDYIDPPIAQIIRQCCDTDPRLRPTFAEIMTALKPFQKPVTSSQVPRPNALRSNAG